MEGTIVVDGVLASCYASFDHNLAHFAMSPIQWFPKMTEWLFGEDNGLPAYVGIIKDFGRLFLSEKQKYWRSQFWNIIN